VHFTTTTDHCYLRPVMGFSPLGGNDNGSPTYIHVTQKWDFSHSESGFCCRDFSSQCFNFVALLMEFSPLESTYDLDSAAGISPSRKPNSTAGIFPNRRMKLTRTDDGTIPTWEHNKHTRHPRAKSNVPESKTSIPRRHNQFQTKHMVK